MKRFTRFLPMIGFALCNLQFAIAEFPRGAVRSPAHHVLAAPTHRVLQAPPAQFALVPKQLDMWGNDQYGDCVTAEEAFAKACFSPEIFIDSNTVVAWARRNGYLHGAALSDVMRSMQHDGFAIGAQQYDDGTYATVDYSSETVLQSAIATGPVKIAIDANALPPAAGHQQGWFSIDCGQQFPNTDHCVSLCGYGAADYLYTQLNVPLPQALPADTHGYLLFTWSTIGFVSHDWLMTTTTEAWVRNPTTVGNPPLTPTPVPPTPPGPSPRPRPHFFHFGELVQLVIAARSDLTAEQAAAVAAFFSDDNSPRVALLKEIVYRRGLQAGLIPAGTEIGAVNWQELITIIIELEPLIVPLIPLLFGDEQAALIDAPFSLCGAGAPPGFRTECGPHGCRLVPIAPKAAAPRPTPPKAAAQPTNKPIKHGKKRLFFRSRTK